MLMNFPDVLLDGACKVNASPRIKMVEMSCTTYHGLWPSDQPEHERASLHTTSVTPALM